MNVEHRYLGDGGEIEMHRVSSEEIEKTMQEFAERHGLPSQSVMLCLRGVKTFPQPEDCGGCGYSFAEIKAGDAEHGCDCGAKLTALECYEQSGMCLKCMWLD